MKKIIFSGKGGAGKTTIISLIIQDLLNKNKKVLVIDADPTSNLVTSLGLDKPEVEPIGEHSDLIPNNWDDYSEEFFQKSMEKSIIKVASNGFEFDYGFLGHHANNSCLCSYNNALNYLLRHLNNKNTYDYVFLDREAGVEHINRSVYGGENDRLIVVAWPTSEYISVAKDIYELADMLGTTDKRLLVINNAPGLNFSETNIHELLSSLSLGKSEYVVMPKLVTFKGLQKLPAHQILKNLDEEQLKTLEKIVQFID